MNNQELKAKLIEQAKEILPKGFGISVRVGSYSIFSVTIKTPYVFAHLDKLDPIRSVVRNYKKKVESIEDINHYHIEDHFNLENEQSKELTEVLEKVTGIYNKLTAKDGWYDESEQRWVSFTYFNLYLKPSKKAIENAEYKVAEYTWNENKLEYDVVCK
ncbi:MAG: hypothetical protein ACTTIS_00165 [Streptobacillus sp.]